MNTKNEQNANREILVTATSDGREITRIMPGETVTLQVDENGDLMLVSEDINECPND